MGKGTAVVGLVKAQCNGYGLKGAMRANCTEILTLVAAITEAKKQGARSLLLVGDSRIALNGRT